MNPKLIKAARISERGPGSTAGLVAWAIIWIRPEGCESKM